MATKPRHMLFNSQERALSTDQNTASSLHHAALLALGAAVLQGDSAVYGVVSGLTVSATGADRSVTVATGLALRSGTAASSYDSAVSWIEVRAATTVDLSAHIDGANPRWVAIEITDGYDTEPQQVRQIWNPATQSFTATLVDKVRVPDPVISVRAGTPAANPVFPSGGAGVIPLAYVYLGAGAGTVGATDIVMCRPMLRGDVGGDQGAPQRDVFGGGVAVATSGTAMTLRNAGGRFANHRVRWGIQAIDGTTSFTLNAASTDGAALPVADDVIYFYACPAPYPAGYDANLARREHRPGATALTRYQGMIAADIYNAVIVASTVAPQVDSQVGSPTAGSFTMTCAPFAAGATIDRGEAVYLGAGFFNFGVGILAQAYLGAGHTRWTQSGTTDLPTESDVRNSTSTGPNTGDAWLATPLSAAGAQIVPDVAIETIVELSQASASASVVWAYGIVEDSGPTIASGSGTGGSRRSLIRLRTRAFTWTHSETFGANSTLNFIVRGWIDGVLVQR